MTVTAGRTLRGQNKALLDALERRGREGVTPLYALNELGIFRLAARVWDLRHGWGYRIEEQPFRTPDGATVARYVLDEPDEAYLDALHEATHREIDEMREADGIPLAMPWGGIEQYQAEGR